MIKNYEYEERAFLREKDFINIKSQLEGLADKIELDNKMSYFFVLPDINLSIATSSTKSVIKFKGGQLGKGNGFEEREIGIQPESIPDFINLFTALLKISPLESEQFRINYLLPNSIEVALKYTQMWGFHLEIEKTYFLEGENNIENQRPQCKKELDAAAKILDINFIDDSEMAEFVKDCKANNFRGDYSADEFRQKYGRIFQ